MAAVEGIASGTDAAGGLLTEATAAAASGFGIEARGLRVAGAFAVPVAAGLAVAFVLVAVVFGVVLRAGLALAVAAVLRAAVCFAPAAGLVSGFFGSGKKIPPLCSGSGRMVTGSGSRSEYNSRNWVGFPAGCSDFTRHTGY